MGYSGNGSPQTSLFYAVLSRGEVFDSRYLLAKTLENQGFLFFVLHFVLHFIKVLQGHVVIFLRIFFDCSSVNSF